MMNSGELFRITGEGTSEQIEQAGRVLEALGIAGIAIEQVVNHQAVEETQIGERLYNPELVIPLRIGNNHIPTITWKAIEHFAGNRAKDKKRTTQTINAVIEPIHRDRATDDYVECFVFDGKLVIGLNPDRIQKLLGIVDKPSYRLAGLGDVGLEFLQKIAKHAFIEEQ